MTTVRRAGVEFEVTLRRSGTVRLRHRDGDKMIDHGDICRWERVPTHRIVFVRLHDGIFPPITDGDRPPTRTETPIGSAPGCVVDQWLHTHRSRLEQL